MLEPFMAAREKIFGPLAVFKRADKGPEIPEDMPSTT